MEDYYNEYTSDLLCTEETLEMALAGCNYAYYFN